MPNVWRTAIYCRKSKENESSIEIQEEMLKGYLLDRPELLLVDSYLDNGYTGKYFERPAWRRLLDDIENSLINCIVVKDLSRIGRDFDEVEKYLAQVFPLKNVRVIAVNDHYDSNEKSFLEIDFQLKNFFNDRVFRETSVKTRKSLEAKMSRGEVGSKVPYGYVKFEKTMVPDPEKAKVVRQIFEWVQNGAYLTDVANNLKDAGIPSPTGKEKWSSGTIKNILREIAYTGDYETGRRRMVMRKKVEVSKDEINRFEKHHEAIIDDDVFDQVQFLLDMRENLRHKDNAKEDPDPLKGLTHCALCGKALAYIRVNPRTYVKKAKYYCKYHTGNNPSGEKLAQRPEIEAEELKEVVVKECNEHLKFFENMKFGYEKEDGLVVTADIRKEKEQLEARQNELTLEMCRKYEDYYDGKITIEDFTAESEILMEEHDEISDELEKLLKKKYRLTMGEKLRSEILSKNKPMEEFDKDTVRRMVSDIILEPDGTVFVDFKLDEETEGVLVDTLDKLGKYYEGKKSRVSRWSET